jgi:cytochrome d ubiquinol oxidase subunit II
MVEIWYAVLGLTLTLFIVRDGWNFGAGALHLIVAKNDAERRQVFTAIGPLWSWNEVWLLAAGGILALAFPAIMAAALSGFYLAIFLVLWSLLLRGIAIEVRGHIDDPLWKAFWDFVFAVSSLVLIVLFGAALGNLLRGVPIDQTGEFSLALFTDFGVTGRVGILDWYTVSVGVYSVVVLVAHGATYLVLKTEGGVHRQSRRISQRLWIAALAFFPLISWLTWLVRRDFFALLIGRPAGWIAIACLIAGVVLLWRGSAENWKFTGSCMVVSALGLGAAVALFPEVLRSTLQDSYSMSAVQAGDNPGLGWGLYWWPVAFVLALVYMFFVSKIYRGKARADQ